jgi:hypothetical protein
MCVREQEGGREGGRKGGREEGREGKYYGRKVLEVEHGF